MVRPNTWTSIYPVKGGGYVREHNDTDGILVAYFSAEVGITGPIRGLPLVGVGLLYQEGYSRQYLNAAGWQQETTEENDFHTLPIQRVPDRSAGEMVTGRVDVHEELRVLPKYADVLSAFFPGLITWAGEKLVPR